MGGNPVVSALSHRGIFTMDRRSHDLSHGYQDRAGPPVENAEGNAHGIAQTSLGGLLDRSLAQMAHNGKASRYGFFSRGLEVNREWQEPRWLQLVRDRDRRIALMNEPGRMDLAKDIAAEVVDHAKDAIDGAVEATRTVFHHVSKTVASVATVAVEAVKPARNETQISRCTSWLLGLLAHGEMLQADAVAAATAAGFARRVVRQGKERAGIVSFQRERRWYWRLPEPESVT
jgi:hypothetical protein